MRKVLLAAAVSVLGLTTGAAHAATIVYSFVAPTDFTELNQTGMLSLFNPALGTLTGVSVTVGANEQTSSTLTNNAATATRARFSLDSSLFYSSSVGTLNTVLGGLSPTLGYDTGFLSYASGQARIFGPYNLTDTNTFTNPIAGSLGDYVGIGQFTLSLVTFTGTTLFGGGGAFVSSTTTTGNLFGSVTYEYNAVPEPSTWAMMLMGFGGVGFAVRRSRKAGTTVVA